MENLDSLNHLIWWDNLEHTTKFNLSKYINKIDKSVEDISINISNNDIYSLYNKAEEAVGWWLNLTNVHKYHNLVNNNIIKDMADYQVFEPTDDEIILMYDNRINYNY